MSSLSFQLFSDIHLELLSSSTLPKIPPKAPYLFLAGDIGGIKNPNYVKFLDYCSDNWDKVFYVFGNHEFYNRHSIQTVIAKTQQLMGKYTNVYLLNDSYVELDDCVIYGFVGWTRSIFSTTNSAKDQLNDYRYISTRNGQLTISQQNDHANAGIRLFKDFIDSYNEKKKIIVMTHFPPIQHNMDDSPLKNYYAWQNLLGTEQIDASNVVCWMSGHTHDPHDLIINNIRYVNNPIGYSDENTGFTSDTFSIYL